MATLNLGRIKPVFRGAYAGGTAYVVDDIVTSGNETFICIQAGTGNATSNASYWTKLAAKGADGTDVGATLTTQGDILYRDGSGLQRLAKGTAGQQLAINSGATAPEWVTASSGGAISTHQIDKNTSGVSITRTTYTGTSFAERLPTAMRIVLTPASTSSKILINFSGLFLAQSSAAYWTIFRKIGSGSFEDLNSNSSARGLGGLHPHDAWGGHSVTYIDTPNTTSEVTYAMYSRMAGNSGTGYVIDNGGEMTIFNAIEL